jgi:FkbM family methyltransferase
MRRRAGRAVRERWPNRWVEREVTGVRMAMPWAHRLPEFARLDSAYGQNLLQLAELLAAGGQIQVLDVGANIGDSTMLMLSRVDARVLAVEPDEVFLPYLRHNVGDDPRVVIEDSLLTSGDQTGYSSARRIGGTAAFTRDPEAPGVRTRSIAELNELHPDFADLRLVKSDTDGFDVELVPAIARSWAHSRPVLFFEYDHHASSLAGHDALAVWDELMSLGYTECAIWDNGGHPLYRCTLAQAHSLAIRVQPSSAYIFWDVAAAHQDDAEGIKALDTLVAPE